MQSNTVNVKNLPTTEEVFSGDYIIIEKQTGSHIIDFRDFVIGPSNTSFYNAIVTNIRTVSTYSISLSTAIEKNSIQTVRAVQSNFQKLTAAWSELVPFVFFTQGDIDLRAGTSTGFRDFDTNLNSLDISDISIQPSTFLRRAGGEYNPFIINLRIVNEISQGANNNLYTYRLGLSTLSASNDDVTFNFAVFKPYFL